MLLYKIGHRKPSTKLILLTAKYRAARVIIADYNVICFYTGKSAGKCKRSGDILERTGGYCRDIIVADSGSEQESGVNEDGECHVICVNFCES